MKRIRNLLLALSQQWSLLDQVVVSGGNFLLGIWLARWLGMEGYGHYALWYMIPLLAMSIHQAVIVQPFQSLLANYQPTEAQRYSRQLWQLQLVLGVLLIALAILLGLLLGMPLLSGAVVLAVLVCGHDFLRKYAFAWQQGQQALRFDAFLYGMLALVLSLAYALGATKLASLFWLFNGTYAVVLFSWSTKLQLNRVEVDRTAWVQILKTHYHFSFWLLGAALVQWWAGNGFLLAAAALLGPVALGSLRMAQQLVGICHVFFLAMENAAPVVAAQHFVRDGWEGLSRYLRQLSLRYALPVGLLLVGLALGHPWLVAQLFGAEYMAHAFLVAAYAGLYILVYCTIPLRIAIRTIQRNQIIFWVYVSGAVLNTLLAYPLIQTLGLTGVILGLASVQIIGLLLYGLTLYQYRNQQTTTFISAEN